MTNHLTSDMFPFEGTFVERLCTAGGAGFEPGGGEIFRIHPDLPEEYWVFFAGDKRPGRGDDRRPPSSGEIVYGAVPPLPWLHVTAQLQTVCSHLEENTTVRPLEKWPVNIVQENNGCLVW